MALHNETGKWGEQQAAELLISKGYGILERNWRLGHLEIDIIATKGKRIVFVEVKTRSTDYVDPLTAIDKKKISHMVRSANTYVKAHNLPHEIQFDIILVYGGPDSGKPTKIEHIPDAFLPPLRTFR